MRRLGAWLVFVLLMADLGAVVGQDQAKVVGREEQAAHLDFLGDPLPADAISRLGSTRLRHGHIVRDVAFSPDGKTLASAGQDHTVRLWDPVTGKELRRFTADAPGDPFSNSRWLHCLAFSPDGTRLACGEHNDGWSTKTIRIWEVASGKLLHTIQGHRAGVVAIAFSPDGAMLASASADQTVRLWDAATAQELRSLSGHQGAVRSVAFSPDGKTLATGGDDSTIRLWDTATGRELRRLVGHEREVMSVCFSADGQHLGSGSRDQTVRLWDPATGKEKAVLRGHDEAVLRVCFAPNSKIIASASMDKTIQLWDVAGGKMIGVLAGHHMEVQGLCFSPDGKMLASGASDHRICLWDVKTCNELHPQPGHQEAAIAVGFRSGGTTLVSLGQDKTIRWWDCRKGKQQRHVPMANMTVVRPSEYLPKFGFGPRGDLLALGSRQGGVQLVDMTSGQEVGRLVDSEGPVIATAISPDGKWVVSSDGKRALLWDLATRKLSRRLPEDASGSKFVLFAADGKLLLAGNKASRLWDVKANKLIRDLPLPFEEITSVAFSLDSRLLLCGDTGGNVQLWDVAKGEKLRVFSGLAGYVSSVAVSSDGRLLAGGAWRGIKVWEIETGQERRAFSNYDGDTFALAFTADGRALASGNGDNTVLIWDIPGKAFASNIDDGPTVLDALGKGLTADGAKAHQAIWGLAARPKMAVPYLRTLVKPRALAENLAIPRLIKELDSDRFAAREKASQELHKLGEQAEAALKKAVADASSPEVQKRARDLLDKLSAAPLTPERLQALRALEALEYIGTPAARELLRELAHGTSAAQIQREAGESLERLAKTMNPTP